MSILIHADRSLIRAAGKSRRFVRIALEAPDTPRKSDRLPANIAFVIDRSGSMCGEKIEKAREAVVHGIRSLRDNDRFAVVAYDSEISVISPSAVATPETRQAAITAVQVIEPGSTTDLCGGWLRGCLEIGERLHDDAVGRCILLTDGLANAGISGHDEIIQHVRALRDRRVTTSVFGVGGDFDESFLGRMADAGGGNFHFIESAAQIPERIAQEVGEVLAITARDLVIVVEGENTVRVESLNDFPCQHADGAWRIAVGSLYANQTLDAVLSLTFPEVANGDVTTVALRVEDRDGNFVMPATHLHFTRAGHTENDRQVRNREVDRSVATLFAARAVQDALTRNRLGDFDGARRSIGRCAARIRGYAGDDAPLLAILERLELKTREFSRNMDPVALKRRHYESRSSLKGRTLDGQYSSPRKVVLMPTAGSLDLVSPVVSYLADADPDLFDDLAVDNLLQDPRYAIYDSARTLAPDRERQLVEEARRSILYGDVRILFVRQRLSDNWFSHWHAGERTAVVSLADWDGAFGVSARAFVAYEVVQHGLRAAVRNYDPFALVHDETRGCLMDFCQTRADIEVKLHVADLCPECFRKMASMGLSRGRLLRLTEIIRTLATTLPTHAR